MWGSASRCCFTPLNLSLHSDEPAYSTLHPTVAKARSVPWSLSVENGMRRVRVLM